MTGRGRFPHLPEEAWTLFLADELPEPSNERLEAHLETCSDCRDALEQADPTRLFRRLRGLRARPEVLDGLWDDVRDAIGGSGEHQEDAGEADEGRGLPASRDATPGRDRLGLLAGAACLVTAVLALQLARAPRPEQGHAELEPCARVASLALTREECRALFVDARFDEEPVVFVRQEGLDLGDLP